MRLEKQGRKTRLEKQTKATEQGYKQNLQTIVKKVKLSEDTESLGNWDTAVFVLKLATTLDATMTQQVVSGPFYKAFTAHNRKISFWLTI